MEYLSYVYVTAVLGEDFTEPSPPQVTFSSGDLVGDTACATFGIINDNNLEFDHEFTVNIESVTPTGSVISNSSTTIVSIMDDEGMHCVAWTVLIMLFPYVDLDPCIIDQMLAIC